MRQASNFRLEENIINTINVLANDLHTTKTDIIEQAVLQFAASMNKKRNVLLQFAGSLDSNAADAMLESIHNDKTSKDIDLDL